MVSALYAAPPGAAPRRLPGPRRTDLP